MSYSAYSFWGLHISLDILHISLHMYARICKIICKIIVHRPYIWNPVNLVDDGDTYRYIWNLATPDIVVSYDIVGPDIVGNPTISCSKL